MKTVPVDPPALPPDGHATSGENRHDLTDQNVNAVLEFHAREEQGISRPQRTLERFGFLIGQPAAIGVILLFVLMWISTNTAMHHFAMAQFDPPPYFWLQGMVSLAALLTATVVLIKQNRLARLAEQREHLNLKLALLTEQKAAKLIHLLEELRRDLPNVNDRHDVEAAALQQSMNPDLVLAALHERAEPEHPSKRAPKTSE